MRGFLATGDGSADGNSLGRGSDGLGRYEDEDEDEEDEAWAECPES